MRHRTLFMLSPLALPFCVLFLGGLGLALAQSLGYLLPTPLPDHVARFHAYARLLEPHYLGSFVLSLYVALVSAGGSVVLGSLLAYAMWKLPHRLHPLAMVYKIPLVLPHIAVGFIVLIFWARSGLVASVCHQLGLIASPDEFPSILYGGGGLGMILAYVYKGTPFVMLLAYASLKRLDPRLLQTATMLGASRATVFRRVALPHIMPVAHTSFIILFLYTFGAFEIPYLLGESEPAMLSIEAYNLYFQKDLGHRPAAMAILVLMVLFSIGFIVLYTRLVSRLSQQARKI